MILDLFGICKQIPYRHILHHSKMTDKKERRKIHTGCTTMKLGHLKMTTHWLKKELMGQSHLGVHWKLGTLMGCRGGCKEAAFAGCLHKLWNQAFGMLCKQWGAMDTAQNFSLRKKCFDFCLLLSDMNAAAILSWVSIIQMVIIFFFK